MYMEIKLTEITIIVKNEQQNKYKKLKKKKEKLKNTK